MILLIYSLLSTSVDNKSLWVPTPSTPPSDHHCASEQHDVHSVPRPRETLSPPHVFLARREQVKTAAAAVKKLGRIKALAVERNGGTEPHESAECLLATRAQTQAGGGAGMFWPTQ